MKLKKSKFKKRTGCKYPEAPKDEDLITSVFIPGWTQILSEKQKIAERAVSISAFFDRAIDDVICDLYPREKLSALTALQDAAQLKCSEKRKIPLFIIPDFFARKISAYFVPYFPESGDFDFIPLCGKMTLLQRLHWKIWVWRAKRKVRKALRQK